jgi:hypothetical protein
MRTPQINLTMDNETLSASKELPRNMSASKLLRHIIRVWSYDEKRWSEYKKTEEGKFAREWLKPLRDRLS